MRGVGCCAGSCLGLVLGAALAIGLVAAAARWAPQRLESAVRWAVGDSPAAPVAAAPAKPVPGQKGKKKQPPPKAEPAPRTAASAPLSPPPEDPKVLAMRRRVRERVERVVADSRRGLLLQAPIEFTQEEVQAAVTDPKGPLEGAPRGLKAALMPGKVRLTWPAAAVPERLRPSWLTRVPAVNASLELAPRVENGRLLCPLVGARLGPLPVPPPLVRALVSALPTAPKLPPRAGVLLPAGVGWVEVLDGKVRVAPQPPWMSEPGS